MARGGISSTMRWNRFLAPLIRLGGKTFLNSVNNEMEEVAKSMKDFADANHPWQNRTGQAEATFTVKVVGHLTIRAAHGVHYGKYLEYRWGGRYGVIPMVMDHGKKQMHGMLRRAWSSSWRG